MKYKIRKMFNFMVMLHIVNQMHRGSQKHEMGK